MKTAGEPNPSKSEIVLAVGAHLKNSVALAVGENVFISQHIGDLETEPANAAFRRVAGDLPGLYDVEPEMIAADLHPDYLSTQFARESGKKNLGVQHHVAHVLSCIAENEVAAARAGRCVGRHGLWPGRHDLGRRIFSRHGQRSVERVAHLRPFRLPGGDKAVKEPRRAALGLLL